MLTAVVVQLTALTLSGCVDGSKVACMTTALKAEGCTVAWKTCDRLYYSPCECYAWGGTPQCTSETCNGKDDDCDGAVDEGCGCTTSCGSTGTWSGVACTPPPESCTNSVDDDCDGAINEGCPAPSPDILACGAGAGIGKVLPTNAPSAIPWCAPGGTLRLQAGRNEFEGAEVVVYNPPSNPTLENVSVSLEGGVLTGPNGAVLRGASVATLNDPNRNTGDVFLYREAYVDVAVRSGPHAVALPTGRWPDALVPDVDPYLGQRRNAFPFSVPAGENRVVYVEVHVPSAAPAGVYSGNLSVSWGAAGRARVPFSVEVWNFTLPSTARLATHFGLANNGICRGHLGGDCSVLTSDQQTRALELKQRYAAQLLDHRITVDFVLKGPDGNPTTGFVWQAFTTSYSPFMNGNVPGLKLSGAEVTSVRFPHVWQGFRNPVKLTDDPSTPQNDVEVSRGYFEAWGRYLSDNAWADLALDYTCDEPPGICPYATIGLRAPLVHTYVRPDTGRSAIPTLVTDAYSDARSAGVLPEVDVLVPNLLEVFEHDRDTTSGNEDRLFLVEPLARPTSPSRRLWWYESCMSHGCLPQTSDPTAPWQVEPDDPALPRLGFPQIVVDSRAIENRALPWLTFARGELSGLLYYETVGVQAYGVDPWASMRFFAGYGDGTLLYPGTPARIGGAADTDVAVISLRLKHLRDGLEDYEYLAKLGDVRGAEYARAKARELLPTDNAVTRSMADLAAARAAIAEELKGR